MGLLQNGFRDKIGVFRMYGAGLSNGALPQQLQANFALTGMRRNLTAGEGITDDRVGLPLGYLAGGSYQLPQKPGFISARAYSIDIAASATGNMGLPGVGSASLSMPEASADILPIDDTSPARTASATFAVSASGDGELKMSGSGSASIAVTVETAALVGILEAIGSASISMTATPPILGAEASGEGQAEISMSAEGTMLPTNDADPARTASAMFAITGMLVPYAVGNMVGSALPYTELSPQSLASAVWSAPAPENNQAGSMGSKVNTASSGGVDMGALAEAVWDYAK